MSAQTAVQKKTICFANVHMRPEEYALWDVSRRLSHQSGILYFDGREIAKLFEHTSKDRIYRAARGLVKKGWFEVIAAAGRDRNTGLYSCSRYRVLSAEEWAKKHPHVCMALAESSPRSETGESSLETRNGTSLQNANDQSLKRERPVPETRMTSPYNETYLVKENLEEEIKREENFEARTGEAAVTAAPSKTITLSSPSGANAEHISLDERKQLLKDYTWWREMRWPKLSLTKKERDTINTAVLNGECDLKALQEGTRRILEDLDVSDAWSHAGNKLAAGMADKAEAIMSRRERDKKRRQYESAMDAAERNGDEELFKRLADECTRLTHVPGEYPTPYIYMGVSKSSAGSWKEAVEDNVVAAQTGGDEEKFKFALMMYMDYMKRHGEVPNSYRFIPGPARPNPPAPGPAHSEQAQAKAAG